MEATTGRGYGVGIVGRAAAKTEVFLLVEHGVVVLFVEEEDVGMGVGVRIKDVIHDKYISCKLIDFITRYLPSNSPYLSATIICRCLPPASLDYH